ADGIKTGYTRAAGFNLVASAQRGQERIIATVFGGSSSAARNQRVAELLDLGFSRAPTRATVTAPARPSVTVLARGASEGAGPPVTLVATLSIRPIPRPTKSAPEAAPAAEVVIAAVQESVTNSLQDLQAVQAASTAAPPEQATPAPLVEDVPAEAVLASATGHASLLEDAAPARAAAQPAVLAVVSPAPTPRPATISFSTNDTSAVPDGPRPQAKPVMVSRVSTSGDRHWGINVGTYASRYEAERVLLKTALIEIETLDSALRKVVRKQTGFDANFVGMDERSAALACQRLSARDQRCSTLGP
ncbi:MAG: D-alanyl-D-alanine carboxypeptidase, partial [Rhodobacteraceae bacterium]|nr:D-alanyl-D-alanine carboxypeptidase [Paracoccaceae bacterium]